MLYFWLKVSLQNSWGWLVLVKVIDGLEVDDDTDELMAKIIKIFTDKIQLYVDVDNTIKIKKKGGGK